MGDEAVQLTNSRMLDVGRWSPCQGQLPPAAGAVRRLATTSFALSFGGENMIFFDVGLVGIILALAITLITFYYTVKTAHSVYM